MKALDGFGHPAAISLCGISPREAVFLDPWVLWVSPPKVRKVTFGLSAFAQKSVRLVVVISV